MNFITQNKFLRAGAKDAS